jgi:DinB superfamily
VSEDRSFVAENQAALDRMRAFVAGASDEDLRAPMPAGWTPAAVLGHLAFWDQHALVVLDELDAGVVPPTYRDEDADWINDTSKRFLLAMDPRELAELALAIADETNQRVAALPDDRLREAAGKWFTERRCDDRNEHLDEIEHALGRSGSA